MLKKIFGLLLGLAACGSPSTMDRTGQMKIPYNPRLVGHCYERLKETPEFFQDAVREIESLMRSAAPFAERLEKVMALHMETIRKSQAEPPHHPWIEEDVYLCCVYDMLEAMFAAEAEVIEKSDENIEAKEKRLDDLQDHIEGLPFGSPQYRTGIRPKYEKKISEAKKRLGIKE